MHEQTWEVVAEVFGELSGQILRGLLEAQGIPTMLSQEGAGKVYGLTVGEFGRVEILVPSDHLAVARQIINDYEQGAFATDEEDDMSSASAPEGE